MEATAILKKIVDKGGVIGSCGKLYISDESLAGKYIIECSAHLHTGSVRTLWGSQLVKQIASYSKKETKTT